MLVFVVVVALRQEAVDMLGAAPRAPRPFVTAAHFFAFRCRWQPRSNHAHNQSITQSNALTGAASWGW